jgi:hypothetical protein
MLQPAGWRRVFVATIALALVSACADPPVVPTPTSDAAGVTANLVNKPPLDLTLQGEAWVCKDADIEALFSFSVSIDGGSATTHNIASGTCAMVHSVPTTGQAQATVSVTENVPSGWSLTGITIESNLSDQSLYQPSINPPNASARIANDYGVVITFTNAPAEGCTRTLGYWKTHPEDWDAAGDNTPFLTTTTFFNSGQNYLTILSSSSAGGNAYINLAKQYIAAVLNTGGGASGISSVDAAISGAAGYFAGAPAGIPNPVNPTRATLLGWATTLDNFNNGVIGPGHCPE